MTTFRLSRLVLFGSLIIAAALRIYGIRYAPTAPRARPDEEIILGRGFDLADGTDHSREIFESGWPEGIFRLANLSERVEAKVLGVVFHQEVNPACLYAFNPGAVELPLRSMSALADIFSCLLGALLVRRLSRKGDETFALMAGALAFGCNYLLIRNAHFAVSDSLLTFCCTLCLYFGVRAVQEGAHFVPMAAAAAGAGFGVKYSALAMLGTCLGAGVASLAGRSTPPRRWWLWGFASVVAAVFAFWMLSPSAFAHLKEFAGGIGGHAYRYDEGARSHLLDPSYQIPPGWKFHLFKNLPIAFGAAGLLLAFAGLVLSLAKSPRIAIVLWSSVLAAFAILFPVRAQFVRYAAPAIPALAVGLGVLLTSLGGWARVRGTFLAWSIAVSIAMLALVPPTITALRFDHLMAQPDTRDLASRWLIRNGSKTGAVSEGWYAQTQLLDPGAVSACADLIPAALNPGAALLPPGANGWKAALARGPAGWSSIAHDSIDRYIWSSPGRDPASYVIVGLGYLPCGKTGHVEDHGPFPPDCYRLADVIEPGRMSCDATMDLFDAFYLPYQGFEGLVLPGPRIEIYEHTCVGAEAKAKAEAKAQAAARPNFKTPNPTRIGSPMGPLNKALAK